ncbi:MAG: hypothetical protein JWQ73_2470 [Variovorax sp.]|jgi:hypothetical protein|nr:hypothetical protein [Variovorax sp.]
MSLDVADSSNAPSNSMRREICSVKNAGASRRSKIKLSNVTP